ncbi:MAG: GNAT family N-acetyltransferase [Desertifilum sp. SIO1I2]|nr:GNAT family N-acetyltransferase [Desertifilum sp. SIO1I2]
MTSSLKLAESQPDSFWQTCTDSNPLQPQTIILVAQCDRKVVGMVSIQLEESGGSQECNATLCGLYITPQLRNKGIGSRLVEAAIAAAKSRKIENLLVFVQAENTSAIQLYQKWQFQQVGRLSKTFKYRDRYSDEIILQKSLED